MEKGEVFDSTLLKNMINSLIAEGKRNFAIDLSPLDYIYSDAINVILALNRRILDVSGRLSIMGPSPEVRQILERTGLQNILKIFDTETELLKSSEDIILQTTRYNLADLQTYQQPPPKPKSEYEDFRSEISTAMAPGVPPVEAEPDRGFRQPPQYAPQEPPQQQFAKPAAFKEEEFEAAYKSFETEVSRDSFAPPPVQRPQPPQYAEPFTPPPIQPPRPAAQPYKRPEQEFAPVQEPMPSARRRDAEYAPPKLEPLEPPHAARRMPEEMVAKPEPPAPRAKPRPAPEYAELPREEEEMPPKKRSAMPIVITLLVVVLLCVGGYFVYMYLNEGQKPILPIQVLPKPAPQPTPQPAPAPTPAPEQPPAVKPAPEPAPAPVAVEEPEKPGVKKPAVKPVIKPKKPPRGGEEEIAPVSGKITITSSPPGATIKVDDNVIGATPFVWNKPNIYGEVTIVLSKKGYKDAVKTVEYTGGTRQESFRLEKEEAPVVSRPPEPEPEVAPPPKPAPEPVAPPPPPPAPKPEPAPAPAAGGEAATVFIASIPPVADVYMDGKLIGKTNITKLNVQAGAHNMRFVKGAQEVTKDMTFKAGDNPSQLVNLK